MPQLVGKPLELGCNTKSLYICCMMNAQVGLVLPHVQLAVSFPGLSKAIVYGLSATYSGHENEMRLNKK